MIAFCSHGALRRFNPEEIASTKSVLTVSRKNLLFNIFSHLITVIVLRTCATIFIRLFPYIKKNGVLKRDIEMPCYVLKDISEY